MHYILYWYFICARLLEKLEILHYNFSNDFREDEAGELSVPKLKALIKALVNMQYGPMIALAHSLNCIEESDHAYIQKVLANPKKAKRRKQACSTQQTVKAKVSELLTNKLLKRSNSKEQELTNEQHVEVRQSSYYIVILRV